MKDDLSPFYMKLAKCIMDNDLSSLAYEYTVESQILLYHKDFG
jgi:hypothetical protein